MKQTSMRQREYPPIFVVSMNKTTCTCTYTCACIDDVKSRIIDIIQLAYDSKIELLTFAQNKVKHVSVLNE